MTKKTWIKVKRGILEPKHIDKLGQAWYLYFYILDNANWETGTISEWKDEYAAQDLEKPIGMIREHRKHLASEGYITCEKKRYSQNIIIHNWTDPRRYDGLVQNQNEQCLEKDELYDNAELIQSMGQSSSQSSSQSSTQSSGQTFLDPSLNRGSFIQSQNHNTTESQLKDTTTTEPLAFSAYESNIGMITSFIADDLNDLVETYTDGWVVDAIKVAVLSNVRKLKYVSAILSRWKTSGKDDGMKPQREYRGKQAPESVSDQNARVAQEVMAEMAKGKL